MVLANAREDGALLYVNGDLGTVVDADQHGCWVELQRTGLATRVRRVERAVKVPMEPGRRKELLRKGQEDRIDGKWEIAGAIDYMPLRVAYASTVHKSQGLSLDQVQVNCRDHFFQSPGMLYVALSRCRSAAGLRLVGSPQQIVKACRCDPRLRAWL